MKHFMTAFFVSLGLLGCASNKSPSDDKVHILAAANMEAEQLSLAGEQLLSPHSFMLADKVFDMALAKDPTNTRAKFYKEFLKPPMLTKGFANRSRKFINSIAGSDSLFKTVNNLPNSSLKDFLLSGPSDIENEVQMQEFLVQYRTSLFELYNFLKETEKTELVINLNPILFFGPIKKDYASSCVVKENDSTRIEVVCDAQDVAQRKINQADMIALRQIVGGEFLYTFIYTNYTADGAIGVYRTAQEKKLTQSQVFDLIRKTPSLGNLRKDHAWKELANLGADFSSAWKYANENHKTICPSVNYETEKKRRSYLFDQGLCTPVDNESQKYLALLDAALIGPVKMNFKNAANETKELTVDPFLMAKRPVQDIKKLLPTQFNECKKATAWADPSFGGIIINPDPAFMFKANCEQGNE